MFGWESFAILSMAKKIANSRFFRDEKKILVKAQFKRDKLSKASILRRKATKVVEMTHERIANGWIANAISSQKR